MEHFVLLVTVMQIINVVATLFLTVMKGTIDATGTFALLVSFSVATWGGVLLWV